MTPATATKKLGDLLKDAGLIDDFQLDAALAHQRLWGGKLGSILIEEEFVREEDMARVISEKLHIPYINLFEPPIAEDVLKLIKPEVAKKYNVLPVKKEQRTLFLAMSDPLDIETIDTIRFITELKIQPMLAMVTEIKDALRHYYDKEQVSRTRGVRPFAHRGKTSGGKMELIRGRDINSPEPEQPEDSGSLLPKDDKAYQLLQDVNTKLDALITLLSENNVITREKLASMVYLKKIGV